MTDGAPPQVVLRDLSRSFREGSRRHVVLDGVSATFRKGESIALRGRSGSGKSTLLNLISGIDTPDRGTVEIEGRDVTAMSETDRTLYRREHIGFVYQAFNLVPTLSVADNVRLVLELNGELQSCSRRSAWPSGPAPTPTCCRAVSNSGLRSHARSRTDRR